jgi:hypothetical protein
MSSLRPVPQTPVQHNPKKRVSVLTLKDRYVFFAQISGTIQFFDLDKVEEDICQQFVDVQYNFLRVNFFQLHPEILSDILCDQRVIARRVRLWMQAYLDVHDPQRVNHWTWRVELTLEFQDKGSVYNSNIAISMDDMLGGDVWLKAGDHFESYLTPKLVHKYDRVLNQHHITKCSALMFPIENIQEVILKDMRKPPGEGNYLPQLLCEEDELLDFYGLFAEQIMFPYIVKQYKIWLQLQDRKDPLATDYIRDKYWGRIRERLFYYLHHKLEQVREDKQKEPGSHPKCLLAVVIHPPIDSDPFVVIEFVSLYTTNPEKGYTAMTLEATGRIEMLENVSEFSTSKRLQ